MTTPMPITMPIIIIIITAQQIIEIPILFHFNKKKLKESQNLIIMFIK